jgi:hypothetical protein
MFQNFKELLSFFNAHNVTYLVVGGYAVSFHAQPRFTKGLDLFIKADAANAFAVFGALTGFDIPLENITVEICPTRQSFFVSVTSRSRWTLCPGSTDLILMQRGKTALTVSSIPKAASRRFSFLALI